MRTCKKCGLEKPSDQFPFSNKEKGWRRHRCLDCEKSYYRSYYLADPVRRAGWNKPEVIEKRKRFMKTPEGMARRRKQNAEWNYRNRQKCLDAYGRMCACCGEDNDRFLTIDHVDNNGHEMRKEHLTGNTFYRWLIRNGFPDGFQILCFNCNIGRALNGGICPHKEGSTTRAEARRTKRSEAPSPSETRVKI